MKAVELGPAHAGAFIAGFERDHAVLLVGPDEIRSAWGHRQPAGTGWLGFKEFILVRGIEQADGGAEAGLLPLAAQGAKELVIRKHLLRGPDKAGSSVAAATYGVEASHEGRSA